MMLNRCSHLTFSLEIDYSDILLTVCVCYASSFVNRPSVRGTCCFFPTGGRKPWQNAPTHGRVARLSGLDKYVDGVPAIGDHESQ